MGVLVTNHGLVTSSPAHGGSAASGIPSPTPAGRGAVGGEVSVGEVPVGEEGRRRRGWPRRGGPLRLGAASRSTRSAASSAAAAAAAADRSRSSRSNPAPGPSEIEHIARRTRQPAPERRPQHRWWPASKPVRAGQHGLVNGEVRLERGLRRPKRAQITTQGREQVQSRGSCAAPRRNYAYAWTWGSSRRGLSGSAQFHS